MPSMPASGQTSMNQLHQTADWDTNVSGTQVSLNEAGVRALIQKGNTVQSRIGEYYSTGVQESGIQVYLDAANSNSYGGSGTTWYDLSGNSRNFTLGGATFSSGNSGHMVYDGYNDTSYTGSYSQPAQSQSTAFTWCVWVRPHETYWNGILGNREGNEWTKLTTLKFEFRYIMTDISQPTQQDTWQLVTIVKNGNNAYYYRNGSTLLASQSMSNHYKPAQPFRIGGDLVYNEKFDGQIGAVMVYHRALSTTEIDRNFNAIRYRYSL